VTVAVDVLPEVV
jgi:hypothetical protein